MKESIWGYAILTLGILAVGIIWFFANTTRTDQHNYTLLKETTEAAMVDAVDLAYYRQTGNVRIEEEKFVENFIRRFAENADLSNTYKIDIYDVNTEPPKVSLKVSSGSKTNATGEIIEFNMVNNIDAILETTYIEESEFSKLSTLISGTPMTAGAKYSVKVNETTSYNFYVLTTPTSEATTIDLIMEGYICEDGKLAANENSCKYAWYTHGCENGIGCDPQAPTNLNGPLTAMKILSNATKNWSNINEMTINSYEYCLDEGYCNSEFGDFESRELAKSNIHARMPKLEEVINLINSNSYLEGTYWTSTASGENDTMDAYYVRGQSIRNTNAHFEFGLRPVITLSL